jgi:hypothetical protein
VPPLLAAIVLGLALVAGGCGGGRGGGGAAPSPASPPAQVPDGEVAVPDGGVARGHGAGDDGRVRVPERDITPPLARLRLLPGGREPAVVHRSPVRGGGRPVVVLARPEVRATALIRDADGGTGRIRLTVHWQADCAGEQRRRTVNLPPSQIERIRLAPGALAPVERRRSARVRLPRGCRVTGEAFADATNASGLESFSDPVRFIVTSPGRRHPYLGSRGDRIR